MAGAGKYLARWALQLVAVEKKIAGGVAPKDPLSQLLLRTPAQLGEALKRTTSHTSYGATFGVSFDTSLETGNAGQGRYAIDETLVSKGTLAYEFATRAKDLMAVSKNPETVRSGGWGSSCAFCAAPLLYPWCRTSPPCLRKRS